MDSVSVAVDQCTKRPDVDVISCLIGSFLGARQGQINHWANRANTQDFTLLGASHLYIKIPLLYCFFMFLGCSPRIKIVELFDNCIYYIGYFGIYCLK